MSEKLKPCPFCGGEAVRMELMDYATPRSGRRTRHRMTEKYIKLAKDISISISISRYRYMKRMIKASSNTLDTSDKKLEVLDTNYAVDWVLDFSAADEQYNPLDDFTNTHSDWTMDYSDVKYLLRGIH